MAIMWHWSPEFPVKGCLGWETSKTYLICLPYIKEMPLKPMSTQKTPAWEQAESYPQSQKHFVPIALNQRGQCFHLPWSKCFSMFKYLPDLPTAHFKEARKGRLLYNLKFTISKQMKMNALHIHCPIGQMAFLRTWTPVLALPNSKI